MRPSVHFLLASFGTEADAWGHQEVPILWRTEADFGNHFSSLVLARCVAFFSRCFVHDLSRRVAQRVRDVGNPGSADICRC